METNFPQMTYNDLGVEDETIKDHAANKLAPKQYITLRESADKINLDADEFLEMLRYFEEAQMILDMLSLVTKGFAAIASFDEQGPGLIITDHGEQTHEAVKSGEMSLEELGKEDDDDDDDFEVKILGSN